MFLVKNLVFRIFYHIAPKHPQQIRKKEKKIKDQDSPRRDFLRDSSSQNPKFHRLDPFYIFYFYFSYTQKNPKKFELVLFDF